VPTRFALVNPRLAAGGTTESTTFEDRLEAALISRVNADRYNLWFRGHTRFLLHDDALIVGVPNLMLQEWLQKTFGDDLREAVQELLGPDFPVRFVIDPLLFQAARAEQERVAAPPASPAASPRAERPVRVERPKSPRRWRSLGDFVVGPCNRVAHASALSVVEEPGQGGNPLVFFGPVGTGKTHLLEGIYLGLRRRSPDLSVRYVTAEDFTNAFVHSMHAHKQSSFRQKYRDCSVLLIDDVDFLKGKQATQIEFLHTFDSLLADHKQVVLTLDCHPRLSDDLLPELVDRLLGGAVWSLLPPDADTRLDILRARSARGLHTIPDDVLEFVASQLRGNVRELEGAIHSLRHYAQVTQETITIELAREALGELLRHAVRVVGMEDISNAVCRVLRLPEGSLNEKKRAWAASQARTLAIYLCRKHTAATFGEISRYFGNKTHSSAVAAERKVRDWLQGDLPMRVNDRDWPARDVVERVERDLGR